jgi:hypothetical protein
MTVEQRSTALRSMTNFVVNTLAMTLVFALLGVFVWPTIRRLLDIPPLSLVVDFIFVLSAAIVFVVARDYTKLP